MGRLCMSFYLDQLRSRYRRANKTEKANILDEFCQTSGYHRKYATRLLSQRSASRRKAIPERRGRKKAYDPEALLPALKAIWLATDQMCGKRLKAAMPLWLPFYETHYGRLDAQVRGQLLTMSGATIDRLLQPCRQKLPKRLTGTKPGSLLKHHIPIQTNQWDERQPGFLEADMVAHCGSTLLGDFVWSLTLTDIYSGWTENGAVWNKGAQGVVSQIQAIEAQLPFPILGFDCDNGLEFLNHHLIRYFQKRPVPVQFTRSRPYHKEDNAHVEQKNWTHVRQLFGYYRIDNASLIPLMNDLYQQEWSLLHNYFYPVMKLQSKEQVQTKVKKLYDKPKTPYQRLMESEAVSEQQKQRLTATFQTLNPFELKANLETKLKSIFNKIELKLRKKKTGI